MLTCSNNTTEAQLSACRGIIHIGPPAVHCCLNPLLTCTGNFIVWHLQCQVQHVCLWAAGSSRFTDGVPGHLHGSLPSYCALLFFMTIVAPWEQANNAAMFAEVCVCTALAWHHHTKERFLVEPRLYSRDFFSCLVQPAAKGRLHRHHGKCHGLKEDALLCAGCLSQDLRSSAYAFDKGITGLLGALAAPLVRTSVTYPVCCSQASYLAGQEMPWL